MTNHSYPLVSVNITTYNRAKLLPRCLDSILCQTYPNFEIVIADDCSSDNTTDVVNSYITNNPQVTIKYIKHENNKGNAHTRNTALKHAEGYYIAFMDDDDEWIDPDKLKKQVEIFENTDNKNLAIVCTAVNIIDEKQDVIPKIINHPNRLKEAILTKNGIIYNSTVFTKKAILEEIGGFDTRLRRGVDSDFYRMCIVKLNYDVYFMEDITVAVHEYGSDRITPKLSNTAKIKALKNNIYVFNKFKFYLIKYPHAFAKRGAKMLYLLFSIILGIFPRNLKT
jgi:glycosyltransferase involved in cell wall biosynthesis